MQDELISIIVPVYNVEKYLDRCIMSLQNQSYSCIEMVLVDDGSTDRSGALCDEYQRTDERIRVIHKANGGLSDARNVGLERCQGKYILFVDSDDFVSKDYVKILYENLCESQADLSICGYSVTGNDTFSEKRASMYKRWDAITALKYLLYQKYFTTSAACKLYKRELWEKIKFPVGVLYEDTITIPKVLEKANLIVWCDAVLYGYYKREGSITQSKYTTKMLEYEKVAAELLLYIKERYPQLEKAAISRYVWANIYLWLHMPSDSHDVEAVKANIRRFRRKTLWDFENRKKTRLVVLLTYLGQKNFKKIYYRVNRNGK